MHLHGVLCDWYVGVSENISLKMLSCKRTITLTLESLYVG